MGKNSLSGSPYGNFNDYAADAVRSNRAPNSTDTGYETGQPWVDEVGQNIYFLGTYSAGSPVWLLSGSNGPLNTLTPDAPGAIEPVTNNINVVGTVNQIETTGSGHTITWSIADAFIAPGSIESTTTITAGTGLVVSAGGATVTGTTAINASGAGVTTIGTGGTGATNIGNATGNTAITGSLTASTSLTATLGAITATNGNLVLAAAGNKMIRTSVASTTTAGANSIGTVSLTGGTATVSTSAVTASSIIQLFRQGVGATGAAALGILAVGTITAGTSFVINSWQVADATALQVSDVSVIGWEIIN